MARAKSRLSQAQTAEAMAVRASGPPGPWATHAITRRMGRQPRTRLSGAWPAAADERVYGTPAHHEGGPRTADPWPVSGGSQGNAGLIRGAPTGGVPYGGGRHDGTQYPIPEPNGSRNPRDYSAMSRTGPAFHNSSTIAYDRHIMTKTGTETQQAHPDSPNGQGLAPLADGPVRPVHYMVNRVMAPRYGNTGTRHLDNTGPFTTTTDNLGRPQPLGTQAGSPWTRKWGGTPGLTYIQGMRGTAGVVSPVAVGAPGDGPQMIRGGQAHGLHSRSQPDHELIGRRYAMTPQQRRGRRSLPRNSARSGQSWSMNAQQLGGQPRPAPSVSGTLPGPSSRLGR